MIIERSANHSHFYTKDQVVYEKLTTGKTKTVRKLDFNYPDWMPLLDTHIAYLNKHYEYYKEIKPKVPTQMDLFT